MVARTPSGSKDYKEQVLSCVFARGTSRDNRSAKSAVSLMNVVGMSLTMRLTPGRRN